MEYDQKLLESIAKIYEELDANLTKRLFDSFTFDEAKADSLIANHTVDTVSGTNGASVNILKDETIYVPDAVGALNIFKGLSYHISKGYLIKSLIDNQKPVYVPDVNTSPVPYITDYLRAGIQSAYFNPMWYEGKVIGILSLVSEIPNSFDEKLIPSINAYTQIISDYYGKFYHMRFDI